VEQVFSFGVCFPKGNEYQAKWHYEEYEHTQHFFHFSPRRYGMRQVITGDIKDVKGNIIGGWGEIRPLLFCRVDLTKTTCIVQRQKRLKKSR
jgi:hypothetical protein